MHGLPFLFIPEDRGITSGVTDTVTGPGPAFEERMRGSQFTVSPSVHTHYLCGEQRYDEITKRNGRRFATAPREEKLNWQPKPRIAQDELLRQAK